MGCLTWPASMFIALLWGRVVLDLDELGGGISILHSFAHSVWCAWYAGFSTQMHSDGCIDEQPDCVIISLSPALSSMDYGEMLADI